MREQLLKSVNHCIQAISLLQEPFALSFIEEASQVIANCFRKGNKILIAGNGGSMADSAHFAEELTGIFRKKRPALPAISLSEPCHMSCVGNDLGFEYVFSRAIEAYGKPGDVFVGLTTSGNSPNIVKAFEAAHQLDLTTVAFLGRGGGHLKGIADVEIIIDGFSTSDRVQEVHMALIHILIEMVEYQLFSTTTLATNSEALAKAF